MGTGKFNAGGNPAIDKQLIQGGLREMLRIALGRLILRLETGISSSPMDHLARMVPWYLAYPTSFNYLRENVYA